MVSRRNLINDQRLVMVVGSKVAGNKAESDTAQQNASLAFFAGLKYKIGFAFDYGRNTGRCMTGFGPMFPEFGDSSAQTDFFMTKAAPANLATYQVSTFGVIVAELNPAISKEKQKPRRSQNKTAMASARR